MISQSAPRITGTLSEIVANRPEVQTLADATDIPGVNLEFMVTAEFPNGAWFGNFGVHASSATLRSLPTAYIGQGTAMEGGTLVRYGGAGVGWVAVGDGLNIDATALIPDLRQSLLVGSPLQATDDDVTAILGPSSQAQGVTEYNALKTNRLEWKFFSGATLINQDKLHVAATAYVQNKSSVYAQLLSSPWPQANGSTGWWAKGFCEYVVDGEGVFVIAYVLNTTNSCRVFVDGKTLVGSDVNGKISNAVSSSGNGVQWATLTLVGDKRRVVSIQGVSNLVSIIHDPGITITKPKYVGKSMIFGDSFASRKGAIGETEKIQVNMATTALRLLGWDVVDTATGGTGFLANGGGYSAGKDSYSGYIDRIINDGVSLGLDPNEYGLIWLFGTGNDQGVVTTIEQYVSVIQKAIVAFPNATIAVSSVYEGFNAVPAAKDLNDILYAAVQAAGSRAKWVPVDSYYKWDKSGIWAGAGSVPAPAYNGNADVYFSNAAQGAGDRHPNSKGCAYGAKYYATELIRAGIKYAPPQ